MCPRARVLTGMWSCQALTGHIVNAADTSSYACWPQNDETLLPSKQHLCYQIPPTYSCCHSRTYFPILSKQAGLWGDTPRASTHLPVLLDLLCSAAAEGKQWSRGALWTRAGHTVRMWAVLQDWDCLSMLTKQKKGEREKRRGSTGQIC